MVGGFAVIEAGFPRLTGDIDLLIEASRANEALVFEALRSLPDRAVDQLEPGDVAKYTVVRIGDEIVVDLMQSSCGVTYDDAIRDVIHREVEGVRIPFASIGSLWRMKQTVREKDIPDRLFLTRLLESLQADPERRSGSSSGSMQPPAAALERLCRQYWRPLYVFARRKGHSEHDAQDLTQGFLADLLARNSLARAEPSRGRFRSFLLAAFCNYLANQRREQTTRKRGGGQLLASPGSASQPGYAELGRSIGLSEGTQAVAMHRMRRRYGELLRAGIASTVSSTDEVEAELRHLLQIVSTDPASGGIR